MIIFIIVIIFIWRSIICWYINLLQLNLPNVPDANAAPVWSAAKTFLFEQILRRWTSKFCEVLGINPYKHFPGLVVVVFLSTVAFAINLSNISFLAFQRNFLTYLQVWYVLLFQMKTNRKLVGKRQNRGKKTKIAFNVFVFLLLLSCLLIILINRRLRLIRMMRFTVLWRHWNQSLLQHY